MSTEQQRGKVGPLVYWFVLSVIGLIAFANWQWRARRLAAGENERLRGKIAVLEALQTENIELRDQRDRLLQFQEARTHEMQLLRAEVGQLRERSNDLRAARLALARGAVEINLLQDESQNLKAELASKPRVPRIGGWLGMNVRNVREGELESGQNGIVIISLIERGPAWKAKLEAGDVVLSIDGQPVASTDDFKSILAQKVGGQLLALDVARKDAVIRVEVGTLDWPQ